MKIGAWLSLGFVAVAAASCRETTAPAGPKGATQNAAPLRGSPQRVSSAAERSGARDIDPRAERVCELVQREPARRKAACCASPLSSSAFADCARRLSRALATDAVAVDEGALDACALASEAHFAGCDWVTPSQALPPPACRTLVRGKLQAGAVCHSSLECAAPLHCKGATPSEPGRCAAAEPPGAACHTSSDALAAALMITDLDVSHPPCDGTCSSISKRCEPAREAPSTPGRKTRSVAAGGACENDFDCAEGGCVGEPKHCGMKCAISFAVAETSSQRALALPRRTSLARAD